MDLHINPSLPSSPQTLVLYDFDLTHWCCWVSNWAVDKTLTYILSLPSPSYHTPGDKPSLGCVGTLQYAEPDSLVLTILRTGQDWWQNKLLILSLVFILIFINTYIQERKYHCTENNHYEYFGVYPSGLTNSLLFSLFLSHFLISLFLSLCLNQHGIILGIF